MVKWGELGRWRRCLFRISCEADGGSECVWTELRGGF
jgi:hypothetical protein